MELTFLGTAGSWPTKDRSPSAVALQMDRESVLFDCGEGTQRQFFQSTVSFMRLRRIFITHFHGDHFLGLPGLIQTMCLNNRTEPLDVYGPPDAKEMVGRVLQMGYFTLPFPVNVHALTAGEEVALEGYSIRTGRTKHPVPSLAYRLEEDEKRGRFDGDKARTLGIRGADFAKLEAGESVRVGDRTVAPSDLQGPPRPGRSVVYTGDTAPTDAVRILSDHATVLIHEATTRTDLEARANEWGHSSARQAATIARDANVGTLILTHFSSRYPEMEPLEAEARAVFPSTIAARDLMTHLIRQP
ncbi:MAG: ribonuclease Z [Thermoplasmata archaeon]